MIEDVRDRLPSWLASADPAGAGLADPGLVAAADADSTGLVEVDEDGSVRWTDEAYRLHGRPRWRRVRSIDDVARGLTAADAGRVRSAYRALMGTGDVELLYTVVGETGQPLDVLLRGARPGLAMVRRASYLPADETEPEPAPADEEPAGDETDETDEVVDVDEVLDVVVVETVVETVEVVLVEPAADPAAPVGATVPDPETDRAFRALFDASPSGLAELRDDGTFVRVNDAFSRLVGRTWDSLRDTVYEALIHHEDRASAFVSRTRRETDGGPAAPSEHRLLHSDGSVVWVRARTSPIESPDGPRLLVSLDNVTAARAREEQLQHDALHDALTGLPNRRLVLDRLERAVSRARRAGQRLAVFFIDVDDLKHVNDTHPWQHKAGDVLLTSLAVAMRGALRETDTLGRLAGDEFLAICDEVGDDTNVSELAERLLDAARQPVPLGPQIHTPTVSIGLAVSTGEVESADELLARADAAMYVAKSHGGGRVERADDLTTAAPPDLVGALHRGELRMQYQPVVSLATGAVLGMNAVLRWVHPTLGMLPAHQVRTALDSAAVLPVVDWCIDRAINDVRTVAPSRVEHVSVWLPVPGRAVQATSTRDALRSAVLGADGSQTPDTAPSLVLEVHETDLAALARRPSLRHQLAALAATGPVAVGVEQLSADIIPVGALQLLGAASASIDPELVLAASENESGEALARSLITGATALGVVTIASGIASTEMLEEARRLGVHAVCGDLIGPAASLEVYSDLLHGEHVTLPGVPTVAVVRPYDDEDYIAPGRPVLSAIRALEQDAGDDLLAEALDDADDDLLDAAPDDSGTDTEATAAVVEAAAPDDLPAAEPPTSAPDAGATADEDGEDGEAQPTAPEPERSSRLLLGDVVDLAEQVARELGVTLPPPSPTPVPTDEAPDLVDDVPPPGRTQPRLPGLADLHAALGSPEVNRAFPDRSDVPAPEPVADGAAASDPDADAGTTDEQPGPTSAGSGGGTAAAEESDPAPDGEPSVPAPGEAAGGEAPASDADIRDTDRDRPAGPALSLALSDHDETDAGSEPPSRPGPHIVVIDDVAEGDGSAAPGGGLREGEPEARNAPEVTDITDEQTVDLRVRGSDGPRIVLRPAGVETPSVPEVAPTLHLRGLGGSDGGSIL